MHIQVREVDGFGVHAGFQPGQQRLVPVDEQARLAGVGQGRFGQGVIGELPVIGHQAAGPVLAGAVDADLALQVGGGHAEQPVGEILQIALIADPGQAGTGLPVGVDVVIPAELHAAAILVAQLVVGQVGGQQFAAATVVEVAEFVVEHEAALAHVARHQGVVEVRRQVQIDRLGVIEAVAPGQAHLRIEEAGLAAIIDRELEVGRPQDRHLADPQHRVACGAETGVVIDLDLRCRQLPYRLRGIAGGVGGAVHLADRTLQVDRLGATIAAAGHQLILDIADLVGVAFLVALGATGLHPDRGVLVTDIALGDVVAAFGIEAQVVGAQELVAALERDIALVVGHHGGTGQLVAFDVRRLLVTRRGRGFVGLGRVVEHGQHVGHRAQAPVHRLVVGQGRQADGDTEGEGQQAEGSAHAVSDSDENGS